MAFHLPHAVPSVVPSTMQQTVSGATHVPLLHHVESA